MPFDADRFAAHIDREISARGMSLRQAAQESGVHAGVLSRVRRGDSSPDVKTVALLLDWTGASADQFFTTVDTTPANQKADFSVRLSDGTQVHIEVKAPPVTQQNDIDAFRRLVTAALRETVGRQRD